ncbi:hypothetical protein LU674_001575 [Pseudomonas alloputida]|jgi:hypothetical protein|uniref:Uncharacterized protein n=1 Tax=Pseudomonas alloputida TaxID=1940621 RepID=A0AAW7HFZ1_9PSED|nr:MULTISPECIES: hypothetical protein [Pseudomonas]MDM3951041.1 hypothetical protein [Pseudomonas alloputida]
MQRTQLDEVVAALKVAPLETVVMGASTVIALILFCLDSQWFGLALVTALVSALGLWCASPEILQLANKRAKARHRYPY